MGHKKQDEQAEKLLKDARAKLAAKLSEALGEYKKFWTEKKFVEKVEKAAHLFITEKKLKAKPVVKKATVPVKATVTVKATKKPVKKKKA